MNEELKALLNEDDYENMMGFIDTIQREGFKGVPKFQKEFAERKEKEKREKDLIEKMAFDPDLFQKLSAESDPQIWEKLYRYYLPENVEEIEVMKEEAIVREKTKRNQAYSRLNYTLSGNTYFDYFSKDTFLIIEKALELIKKHNRYSLQTDILLLSFCLIDSEISVILKETGFTPLTLEKSIFPLEIELQKKQNKLQRSLVSFGKILKEKGGIIWKKVKKGYRKIEPLLEKLYLIEKDESLRPQPKFSSELYSIFEICSEKALRYGTPVITPEILFLSILESEQFVGGKIMKVILPEAMKLVLRYKLLKRVYFQELTLRELVPLNQHFFAYLLKTELKGKDFQRLIETKKLAEAVNHFRNKLLSTVIKTDIAAFLEDELFTNFRNTDDYLLDEDEEEYEDEAEEEYEEYQEEEEEEIEEDELFVDQEEIGNENIEFLQDSLVGED